MREISLGAATEEQASLDQIVGDALHLGMGSRPFASAASKRTLSRPILDERGQGRGSGAAKADIAIPFRVQEYNPLVSPACIDMRWEAETLIAHDRTPGARLNAGHRRYAQTQG